MILLCLTLDAHAAPANSGKHAHEAIHLKPLTRHGHHTHVHAASAHVYGRGDDIAPSVVYGSSMHMHREARPEWVRKRL
ncbi:hypothetical protein E4U54_004905 [Claviceps lovelessii]|nr:hypothetical protein E4U54_004905 [Claviceps lovelessii]